MCLLEEAEVVEVEVELELVGVVRELEERPWLGEEEGYGEWGGELELLGPRDELLGGPESVELVVSEFRYDYDSSIIVIIGVVTFLLRMVLLRLLPLTPAPTKIRTFLLILALKSSALCTYCTSTKVPLPQDGLVGYWVNKSKQGSRKYEIGIP